LVLVEANTRPCPAVTQELGTGLRCRSLAGSEQGGRPARPGNQRHRPGGHISGSAN